jgi:hypothetical protein
MTTIKSFELNQQPDGLHVTLKLF